MGVGAVRRGGDKGTERLSNSPNTPQLLKVVGLGAELRQS